MELHIGYRPFTGVLTVHNVENEDALELAEDNDGVSYQHDSSEDNWHIMFAYYNDEFLAMTALGTRTTAVGWNLWLSFILPDDVVGQIYSLVQKWDTEFAESEPAMGEMARVLFIQHEVVEFS